MDDSSEFQEKKDFVGLKKIPKPNNNKKKGPKKLKGQKDIRTALKSKKNELVSYSNEFDKVCKYSGIDVDSEQLQLAIALSKSLNGNVGSPSSSEASTNSRDKSSKIRATLFEYGFKVPVIKIEKNLNKRSKKTRKPYKLLLTEKTEREKIILKRYSQVLTQNVVLEQVSCLDTSNECSDVKLQHITTNISYDLIKNCEVFYIKNLLPISANSIGLLLKDWSTIPGRPVSPVNGDKSDFNFKLFDWTQSELNHIMSGTLDTAHSVINRKTEELVVEDKIDFKEVTNKTRVTEEEDISVSEMNDHSKVQQTERSCSPDIFDDEVSLVFDKNNLHTNKTLEDVPTNTQLNYETMDLTDCVSMVKQHVIDITDKKTVFSQCNNVTKRKSNDLMEITNCISSSSQPIKETLGSTDHIEHEILAIHKNNQEKVNVDLTDDNSPAYVHNTDKIKCLEGNIETMDLTQSSDSCDLPAIDLSNSTIEISEQTVILDESEYIDFSKKCVSTDSNDMRSENDVGPQDITTIYSNSEDELDLTSEIQKSPFHETNETNEQTIEDENLASHASCSSNKIQSNYNEADIDLTQTLESSNEETKDLSAFNNHPKISLGSLGKRDDISLDYDDIIHINNEYTTNHSKEESMLLSSSKLAVTDIEQIDIQMSIHSETSSNKTVSNQDCEVFEISDNELDYSIQRSRLEGTKENFELGGLSILNNLQNSTTSNDMRRISNVKNDRLSESFLPEVNVKVDVPNVGNQDVIDVVDVFPSTSPIQANTPFKEHNSQAIKPIVTPKTDYIIKTDQVTPMLDYASMDTPDRNKELEKYGLKPIKRKRAIQLLTHLYNQTHPLLEDLSQEDLPSPSKKLKTSPQKQTLKKSPRNIFKSLKKISGNSMTNCEENLSDIDGTNNVPDIRDIVCDPEDWVFQKREKAKIHSCKVPLHIALYNYISSQRGLREAILRYEPVNIDVIHKDLVANGYRYDPKDLLKFLDKKCITVKTADNNARNNRR